MTVHGVAPQQSAGGFLITDIKRPRPLIFFIDISLNLRYIIYRFALISKLNNLACRLLYLKNKLLRFFMEAVDVKSPPRSFLRRSRKRVQIRSLL